MRATPERAGLQPVDVRPTSSPLPRTDPPPRGDWRGRSTAPTSHPRPRDAPDPARPQGLRGDGRRPRIPRPVRQRPHLLQPPLAGRPDRPGRGDRRVGRHDARHDGGVPVVVGRPTGEDAAWSTLLSDGACSRASGRAGRRATTPAAGVPLEDAGGASTRCPPAPAAPRRRASSPGRSSARARRSGRELARRPACGAWPGARDGWLASAYNITPSASARRSRAPAMRPTGWPRPGSASRRTRPGRVLADVLAPLVGRPVEELRSRSLPIGRPGHCAERMRAFADAGVQRHLPLAAARRGPAAGALHRAGRASSERRTMATYALIHGAGDVGWYWHWWPASSAARPRRSSPGPALRRRGRRASATMPTPSWT